MIVVIGSSSGLRIPTDDEAESTLFPTPAQLRRINREFVAMVRSWYPRKFYGRTAQHQAFVGAALLRMCDTSTT